ncbi:hypothetical protein [Streptomyces sp. NPDC001978]|uniref:hypothetical protein n=1 Tax=Streptomyces sp. NPDC001978 TaxID=3364627 RepID=UPI003697F02D
MDQRPDGVTSAGASVPVLVSAGEGGQHFLSFDLPEIWREIDYQADAGRYLFAMHLGARGRGQSRGDAFDLRTHWSPR